MNKSSDKRFVLTENQAEEYKSIAFLEIHQLETENKILKKEYKDLIKKQDTVNEEYYKAKVEYNEMCLSYIGKGKFALILSRPEKIRQRILSIEANEIDYYKMCVNDEIVKQGELLLPILREDLEDALNDVNDLEKLRERIILEYEQKLAERKNLSKRLRSIGKEINHNNKRITILHKLIKYIDSAYENGKKVKKKKLVIKKSQEV